MRTFFVVGVAMLAGFLMHGALRGPAAPVVGAGRPTEEVRARAFIVVDERGNEHARLSVDEGVTRLVMLDGRAGQRLKLLVDNEGSPSIQLTDAKQQRFALLGVEGEGGPSLAFASYDADDELVELSSGIGGAMLSLWGPTGRLRLSLREEDRGDYCLATRPIELRRGPTIELTAANPSGASTTLCVDHRGDSGLVVRDSKRVERVRVGVLGDDAGIFSLRPREGTSKCEISQPPSGTGWMRVTEGSRTKWGGP